ncbi:hypothetical protein GIB67_027847 [Kingdonia uniflora]|uniref:Glucan endo-1,3-beta-D-glucosidase n=1 Tax=Kingdonia uniflora TaxID=39325 RepID=A0A7J7P4J0_9MAGN|nr:hypothetical protein GIB67_027847 [Kingdonia uniflora]
MAPTFHLLYLAILLAIIKGGSSSVGVCYSIWGNGSNFASPANVVEMYQSNNISRMRLYEPNHMVFDSLQSSGIQVVVGVRREDISLLAMSYDAADLWVQRNIRNYWPYVHFRYITVGNEDIPGSYAQFVLPAIQNLHNALRVDGLWHRIKVTTVVSPSVLSVSSPPSAATFSDNTIEYMAPIVRYLYSIGAPLLTNVYPYFGYVENPIAVPLPYALFTSKNNKLLDSGLVYTNFFDVTVDAFYASLEKVGVTGVPVAVAETGWPSNGRNSAATIWNSWVYITNLIRHVMSSQGTPRRPGEPIETYLFAMFNEEWKLGGLRENHFGLFNSDLSPVYPLDFMTSCTTPICI